MSKKVSIEFEFRDDFEPGDCYDCPFGYEERSYDEDDGFDYWNSCCLGTRYDECYLRDKFNIY